MRGFIAGAITTGPGKARHWAERISSAEPVARRARVVADAGAMTNTSASPPGVRCPKGSALPVSEPPNMLVYTASACSEVKVSGVTKCCAACVRVTLTRMSSRW